MIRYFLFDSPNEPPEYRGGSSQFEPSEGVIGFRGSHKPKGTKWWNHMPAKLIKNNLGSDTWNRYLNFK